MWKRIFFLYFVVMGIASYAQDTERCNLVELRSNASSETARYNRSNPPRDETGQVYCETDCCLPCFPKYHVEIGGSYTYAYLKPEDRDHLSGNMGGIQALFEYQSVKSIYQGVTFAWRQGTVEDSVKRDLFDIDTQARLGYTFGDCCGDWLVSVFTGLGYRHISHDLSTGGSSVALFYNTLYVPVGFVSNWNFSQDWYLGLNFQWRPQAYPTVRIDPLDGARWMTEYTLANVFVELPLTYVLCCENRCSLILKPFFEYWQDGKTTAKALGIVLGMPKNTYLFGGFSLNFRYSF